MKDTIENSKFTILFDEDRAMSDYARIQSEYADYVKDFKKKRWLRDAPLAILMSVLVIVAGLYAMPDYNPVEPLNEQPFFLTTAIFFALLCLGILVAIVLLFADGPDPIKSFYDTNTSFYLFKENILHNKSIIGAMLYENNDGFCTIALKTVSEGGYVSTEPFEMGFPKELATFTKRVNLKVDKITVDIVKGEVQYPFKENTEDKVITNE